ncbi:MAG: sensor histidine kinase, partial [Acidimicrobiia bacterium]
PTELALVFHNLISNAVKYRRPEVQARVHLSANEVESQWRIAVDDNGLGIDERHRDRVFRVFQRLPGQPAEAGTGIGLAVCRRIVEGHGGRIWVEGNSQGGTRACFTVPIPVCWSPF